MPDYVNCPYCHESAKDTQIPIWNLVGYRFCLACHSVYEYLTGKLARIQEELDHDS